MRCSWDRLSSRCFKDYLYLLNSSLERCNFSVIQDRSPVNTRDAKWPNISVIPQKFCLIQCIRNRNWMHQLNSVTAWQVLIKPVKNQSCSSTVQIQAYSCRTEVALVIWTLTEQHPQIRTCSKLVALELQSFKIGCWRCSSYVPPGPPIWWASCSESIHIILYKNI
jgi:hypothetical protein